MLSTREVLSSDWINRYKSAGLDIVDYREIEGRIKPKRGKITVV